MTNEQRTSLIEAYFAFTDDPMWNSADDSDQGIAHKLEVWGIMTDDELLVLVKEACDYEAHTSNDETREYYADDVDGDAAKSSQLIAKIMEIEGRK